MNRHAPAPPERKGAAAGERGDVPARPLRGRTTDAAGGAPPPPPTAPDQVTDGTTPRPPVPQLAANFSSLIAAKSLTSPPIRFVA